MPDLARVHGGIDPRELAPLGLAPEAVADFSVNINPYGPTPQMLAAIRAAPVERYPDPTAWEARRAVARQEGLEPEHVLLGAGASELLWSAARALLGPGQPALVVEPAFSELRAAVACCGAPILEWRAREEQGFRVELAGLPLDRACLLYLCNPASPTGVAVPAPGIAALAAAHPRLVVLLDESFLPLSELHADAGFALPANVLRVRSLTKAHAIPGVRVGCLIGDPERLAAIDRARPAWSAGAAAQAAAIAACAESGWVAECRERMLADRDALAAALFARGRAPLASSASYFLLPAGDGAALRARLLRHGVLVRDCASFGLPRHVRIGARPEADRARLLEALELC